MQLKLPHLVWHYFVSVIRLVRADPTGRLLFRALLDRILSYSRIIARKNWEPRLFIEEEHSHADLTKWAIVIHIHFEDYVPAIIRNLEKLTKFGFCGITTTSESILINIKKEIRKLDSVGNLPQVRLVENRGRNFGPLLLNFRNQILELEGLIHLHSKKSTHMSQGIGQAWAARHWELLLENEDLINRAINILDRDANTGLVYPYISDVVSWRTNYDWATNLSLAERIFSSQNLKSVPRYFPFPAGGMFAVRTKAIEQLFVKNWSKDDFPPESGQLDGTTQHVIERMIGVLCHLNGFEQVVYYPKADKFTKDLSFVSL